MAGKNQHHVWQLLQRGFADEEFGDHHLWVYRSGEKPKRTVTRKFGCERFFYGPQGSKADTNITEFEQSFQGVIQSARAAESKSVLDPNLIGPIIASLEARSYFFRQDSIRLGNILMGALEVHFRSRVKVKLLLKKYLEKNPEKIMESIGIREGSPELEGAIREYLDCKLPELVDKLLDDGGLDLSMLEEVKGSVGEIVRTAQIEALQSDLGRMERVNLHLHRKYIVQLSGDDRFILPDTGLCFLKKDGISPMTAKGDVVDEVLFPISDTVLIVGTKSDPITRSVRSTNRLLAVYSYQGFASRSEGEATFCLRGRIGKHAETI
ncbi:MAG: DUF4238 domain-containing protein [Jannaschia sp.]